MKQQNIIITIGIILLATLWIQYVFPNHNETDRYAVITGNNMLTILVDKKTGLTWRNSLCDAKHNIPGCWSKMYTLDPENFNAPEGEALIRTKLWPAHVKKVQKAEMKAKQEAAKQQRFEQNNTQNQQQSEPIRIQ